MEGRRTSRRPRLRWVDYMQRGLAGLQQRARDYRVQTGVEYGSETGSVTGGEENISREQESMPASPRTSGTKRRAILLYYELICIKHDLCACINNIIMMEETIQLPVLTVVDCGSPGSLAKAEVVFNGTTFEDTANYTCEVGFRFSSGVSLVLTSCGDIGNWTASNETCEGQHAVINCSEQYVLNFCITLPMPFASKQNQGGIPFPI